MMIQNKIIMHYSFHSTPTCTFKGRSQTITRSNQKGSVPGPADYNVKKPLPQSATIANTSQVRNLYKKIQQNPGPGAYESKSYVTEGIKRSISLRFIDHGKNTPGPQDYQVQGSKLLAKSPAFSLGKKSKSVFQIDIDNNSFKPGPTTYNKDSRIRSNSGVFIGTSHRKDLTETEKTPGPNYYMTASAADFSSHNNPQARIGSQLRKTDFNRTQKTPGPAAYNKATFVEQNSSKKKGYSCRKKVEDLVAQQLSRNPGPGQYESHLKNKNKAPRCATTQTKRRTFMDDATTFKKSYPGPGYHQPGFSSTKYRCASASSFRKSVRQPLDENQKTPGPAEYESNKIKLLNSSPSYSSTKNVKKNEFLGINPETAAPGQYDPKITLVKPRSSISEIPKQKRPDYEKHRQTPGPGFYNLRGKEQGPTWRFSTEKRQSFTDQKNEVKNRTHYELASKVIDPPPYMNVTSKVQFQRTGLTSA